MRRALLLSLFAFFACQNEAPKEELPPLASLEYSKGLFEASDSTAKGKITLYFEDLQLQDSLYELSELEEEVRQNLLSNNANFDTVYHSYLEMIDGLREEFKRLTAQNTEDWFERWEYSQSVEVFLNEKGLLGISSSHYAYTGGAHGNTHLGSQLYRLRDQTRLTLDSLLIPGTREELSTWAEAEFRVSNLIPEDQSLEEAGYWFDKGFYLPDYFIYRSSGLDFVYGSYEVGPYALGQPRFRLPYAEVERFIREEYRIFGGDDQGEIN